MENLTFLNNATTPYEVASTLLWSLISPILISIGIIGNTVAFLVLVKLFIAKKSTFHLFLAILSLNDMVVLLSGLTRYWIISVFELDVRDEDNVICKLQLYVIYTTMQYSAWILVSVTLQRCMIVSRPTKFKQIYTPKFAGIQLGIIFIILSAINFHFFFTNGIKDDECNSLTDEIYQFDEYVFVWIDLFILCLIPFVIMLSSNIYFMTHVHKYSSAVNTSEDVIGKKIRHSIQIIMRLTWLFLATNLPICLFMIFDSYYKDDEDGVKSLLKAICSLTQYAGFSLNICLYVTVDPKFLSILRKEARKLESSFRSRKSIQLKRKLSSSSGTTRSSSRQTRHTQEETFVN